MDLILDTNIWVAYLHDMDSQHEKAERLFEIIDQEILIPEYILVEILNILSTKVGKSKANDFLLDLANANRVNVIWSSNEFRKEVLDFFTSNDIEKLSFVDQCLLYLSRDYKIVTFDKELWRLIK